MATMYFIQNCLKRVLYAPCDITNSNKRVDDIAEAIRIANNESIEDAHKYLVALVTEAEAGKYASQQGVQPTLESGRDLPAESSDSKGSAPAEKIEAVEQTLAPDVCPVCAGKRTVTNTHGVEQFCIPCDGTGQSG